MAELLGRDPIFNAAEALEAAVLADSYFTDRRCFPNMDFYFTVVYHTMGTSRSHTCGKAYTECSRALHSITFKIGRAQVSHPT